MKICELCKHYKLGRMNRGECSKAGYNYNDYGAHHVGDNCIHSPNLESLFESRDDGKDTLEDLRERLFQSDLALKKSEHEKNVLKERLTSVEK